MNGRQRKNRNIKGQKKLRSINSYWVVRHRPYKGTDGRLWEEDNVLWMQIVGKGLSDKLK